MAGFAQCAEKLEISWILSLFRNMPGQWQRLANFMVSCPEHSSESANFIAFLPGATLLHRCCQRDQILPKIGLFMALPMLGSPTRKPLPVEEAAERPQAGNRPCKEESSCCRRRRASRRDCRQSSWEWGAGRVIQPRWVEDRHWSLFNKPCWSPFFLNVLCHVQPSHGKLENQPKTAFIHWKSSNMSALF